MNILFVHQNFPGQFRHLAPALAKMGHRVVALAVNAPRERLHGVSVVRYIVESPRTQQGKRSDRELDELEVKFMRGRSAALAMQKLKDGGFVPDVVFAHSGWGEALFIRQVFPRARMLVYAEYFYGTDGGDTCFDPEFSRPSLEGMQRTVIKNTHLLHALNACDAALSPTEFQRSQHPAWAQDKIRVIHEGIDTTRFCPNAGAWVKLQAAGLTLRAGDEVVTFVVRQLEPYRGYHTFMRALPLLQKLRPEVRVVLVGGDGVSYGAPPPKGNSWKAIFLEEVAEHLDMSRIHFVGSIPHALLTSLMQVSATHVYLTYPFVLSWSLLEAMSIGCLIIGSDTAPVREVIRDGENGLLVDFFDPEALARTVAESLQSRANLQSLREAAREAIVRKYDLQSRCLPELIGFVLDA